MVPPAPTPESLPKYKLLVSPAFVTVQVVPLVQVGVTVEAAVFVPAVPKVENAIAPAVTEHVPITLPEAVIVPEAVVAKVLLAVDKSNAELTSNNFFNLFIFFYISYLRNIN
jgi:hypothetical protein